jgi:hypothetical protein
MRFSSAEFDMDALPTSPAAATTPRAKKYCPERQREIAGGFGLQANSDFAYIEAFNLRIS